MNARATGHEPSERGFVLLAVLILIGLVALVGASYGRHVTLEHRSSPAASAALRSGGAVDSGLQYARQLVRTGPPSRSETLVDGSTAASLQITDLGGGHGGVHLRSVDSRGLGATLLLEIERTPLAAGSEPDALPRLRPEAVAALLADATVPKTWVSGLTTISDQDLDGLIVIRDGAVLALRGVSLTGTIVSETTLTGDDFGPYDVIDAPTLLIEGDLSVKPALELPGIAIVLPDGLVTTTDPAARLQLDGDVVAHSLILDGSGALRGNLAAVVAPTLAPAIERPGAGRGPRPWAIDLDLGERSDLRFVAVVPRVHQPADLPAILGFDFDAP